MLRFFRALRRKLIEEDNMRKYFWYAIGEVFLVVIGILIALQINNWNIERQTRSEEKNYLSNLKRDLQINIRLLDEIIEYNESNLVSTSNVTKMSEQAEVEDIYAFIENILNTMMGGNFTPNKNTYEEMKSAGKFSLITNEYIKQRLLALDEQFVRIEGGESHVQREYEQYIWDEFVNVVSYREYFVFEDLRENLMFVTDTVYVEANKERMIREAEEILANTRFQNGLYLYEMNYLYLNSVFHETKNMVEELILLIDNEIAE